MSHSTSVLKVKKVKTVQVFLNVYNTYEIPYDNERCKIDAHFFLAIGSMKK